VKLTEKQQLHETQKTMKQLRKVLAAAPTLLVSLSALIGTITAILTYECGHEQADALGIQIADLLSKGKSARMAVIQ
jgi:hypothetical protein